MTTYAFIFARGGSKGIPKKNIKNLNGKPLISYSISLAKMINEIDRIFVSTDDYEIKIVSEKYGAEVIDRPKELAEDTSPEWDAWRHAVSYVQNRYGDFDRFISLPTTSPLRSLEDVRNSLDALDQSCEMVIGITPSHNNPYFNMVKREKSGIVDIMIKPDKKVTRRQDAPDSYNITTVAYVTTPDFVMKKSSIFDGLCKGVIIPSENAIDLDSNLDFKIAEYLLKTRT